MNNYLVGLGTDDHRIKRSRGSKHLILGGVIVSKEHTPIAHSDGDVVYHALCNALFLAIGERDLGYHFPDTDKRYSNLKSNDFVEKAIQLANRKGYIVNNVSLMITATEPRISPYVERMKKNISGLLKINKDLVGIGATTGEGLSDAGRGKGISAIALVSLVHK